MKFKKLESGRSMVEMLGVLAIIGVLSVGGIAGYSLSMRRHRANGVVDLMTKYSLIAYGNCQQKVMNSELTDVSKCSSTNAPLFSSSDIGSLPAGVTHIGWGSFVAGVTYTGESSDPNATLPYTVDTLWIDAVFSDQKLCQAVASVTGSACKEGGVRAPFRHN